MSFRQMLASLVPDGEGLTIDLPGDWLQGRTAYGGLTGALCVEAAARLSPDLPPLRSAQFALAGPASGRLAVRAEVVRQGKSAVVIEAAVTGEAGPAARALLTYGAARDSRVLRTGSGPAAPPAPEACPAFFAADRAPSFARHFDVRLAGGARPLTPGAEPRITVWIRHGDGETPWGLPALVALADAVPSPALVLFPEFAPFSTMTWSLDLTAANPTSASGWWLLDSTIDAADGGYASQDMSLWNDAGELVARARQMVAVFI
jgi:acyl-CoA thioesterase